MTVRVLVPTIALILSACATTVPIERHSTTSHVEERNFQIGVEKTSSVGEPMLKVRDYYVTQSASWAWRLDEPLNLGGLYGVVPPGTYAVAKQKVVGGETFDLIYVKGAACLVAQDGRFAKVMNVLENVSYDVSVKSGDPKLTKVDSSEIDKRAGYKNFELIYTGISANDLKITYREFSPDDLARTAFFQDLTYSRADPVVQFRDIVVRVQEATNRAIRFVVERAP